LTVGNRLVGSRNASENKDILPLLGADTYKNDGATLTGFEEFEVNGPL
jgi:hypothetical protein